MTNPSTRRPPDMSSGGCSLFMYSPSLRKAPIQLNKKSCSKETAICAILSPITVISYQILCAECLFRIPTIFDTLQPDLITPEPNTRQQSHVPRGIDGQRLNPLLGDELVSRLHCNSAYLCRRAALASLSDTSGHSDKVPVLDQSCRTSNVRIAIFLAPIKSAWRV